MCVGLVLCTKDLSVTGWDVACERKRLVAIQCCIRYCTDLSHLVQQSYSGEEVFLMEKGRKFKASTIPVVAFLMALEIILTRFLSINTPIVRIGFGFVPVALTAIIYGPWWAAASYAIGDILGALLFPIGPYFPGFTLTAFLTGMTFGLFLYKKQVMWKTVLPASLIICIVLNLGLDTFWLYLIMNQGVWALMPARILKTVIMIPLQVLLIPLIWKKLSPLIPKLLED